jgi:hypothetical protein
VEIGWWNASDSGEQGPEVVCCLARIIGAEKERPASTSSQVGLKHCCALIQKLKMVNDAGVYWAVEYSTGEMGLRVSRLVKLLHGLSILYRSGRERGDSVLWQLVGPGDDERIRQWPVGA